MGSKREASVQEIDLVEELKRLIQRMAPDLRVSVRSKPDFYVGQANTLPGLEIALERDSRPKYNIVLDGDTWRIFFPAQRRKSVTGDATKGEASVTAVAKWIMDDLGRKPETREAEMTYVLAHKGPNDTTYCKNKAGDWTTHIEDAYEGSGPESFSSAMKQNFADSIGAEVEDLEVMAIEKFENKNEASLEALTPRDIQNTARAAWNASGAKDFELDIVRLGGHVIIYTKGLNGHDEVDDKWEINFPHPVLNSLKKIEVDHYPTHNAEHAISCMGVESLEDLEQLLTGAFRSLQKRITAGASIKEDAMNNSEIKGAVNAAWSAAGTKLFKLDINDDPKHSGIDVYPKTMDGELCGVSWRILPDVGVIGRYADNLKDGTSEVIAELNFKDLDELEKIFTDEFASLDETLQISLENGGWETKVSAKVQYLDEFDPEYSGKETIVYGVGPDKETAKKNALTAFFMENPDAEIHGTPLFSVVEKNEKVNPKSADEITADEFAAYRKVQMGGKYNMLMDSQAAAMDAGLDDETYWGIIKNYSDLYAKYGG